MQMKKWNKIVSLISALALILTCFSGITVVSAEATSDVPDFKALIEEKISVSNDTTVEDINAILAEIDSDLEYSGSDYILQQTAVNFYKMDAIAGAYEIGSANEGGSTYEGAPVNDEILVEGIDGYIGLELSYQLDGVDYNTVVTLKIEAPMQGYGFTSCSNDINDWAGDNTNGYYWNRSYAVDKLVIPEGITTLVQNNSNPWHRWQSPRCLVYNDDIKLAARALYIGAEVVVLGDSIETLDSFAFYFATKLKYIRLPDSLKTIATQAFRGCTSLTHLYIPYGVETIMDNIFYVPGQDDVDGKLNYDVAHKIKNLTIPASLKSMYGGAFAGPGVDCNYTFLTVSDSWSWSLAYNNSWDASLGEHVYIRGFGPDASYRWNASINEKVNLTTDMTLAEAAARSAFDLGIYTKKVYSNAELAIGNADGILDKVKTIYGNTGMTAAFTNSEWEIALSSVKNTITISKGASKAIVDIEIPYVFDSSDAEITVTNSTTMASLNAQLNAAVGSAVTITDFYKMEATPEVVEVGSTYPGAVDGLILVPGKAGYVSAYYTFDDNGTTRTASLLAKIEPERVEKAYTSITTDDQWQDQGGGFYKYTGGWVDKMVVPDFVTGFVQHWYNWQQIKCLVYGKGTTHTGQCLWNGALEVVVMPENIKTVAGWGFNSASGLKYVHMEAVETIDDEAFKGCTSLEYINLPSTLKTIGRNAFAHITQATNVHNLTKLDIPASVQTIRDNAFNGAANPFEITILGAPESLNEKAFYNADYDNENYPAANYQNNNVRVWKAYDEAKTVVTAAADNKTYLDDTMGLAEISARVQSVIDKYSALTYDSADAVAADADKILAEVAASYGNPNWTAAWATNDWAADKGFLFSNSIIITKGDDTLEVPFFVKKAGKFDLQALADEANMVVDNNTTKTAFNLKLADLGLSNYDIEILDFYKLNSYNGAVEVTATGKETLVPWEDGYVTAIVKVTGNNGESVTSNLFFTIDAVVEEYTFTTVSNSISDWSGNNTSGWTYAGGSVDKLIIPDEITALTRHWYNWKQIKCLVYGAGMAHTGQCQWNGGLQVVVMHENTKMVAGWGFNSASNLKYVYMPAVETIDDEAFKGCTSLTTLKLPNTLKTIGKNSFAHLTQATNVHNLTQLEVPASVNNIRAGAFNGATKPFEITLLSTGGGVNATAFYDPAQVDAYPAANYQNNIVRVYKGTTTDSQVVTVEGCKQYINNMTVAEAHTRVQRLAAQLTTETFIGVENLETKINNAILNVSGITYEWANLDWAEEGEYVSNEIILTDGVNTLNVELKLLAPAGFYADGASILDTADWSANGYKQGLRFYNSYKSSATDKIDIDGVEYTIKDFGILVKHISNDGATAGSSAIEDSAFVIGAEGVIVESGKAGTVVRNEDTSKNQFSVYITNIPQAARDYHFQSRGYIVYEAADSSEVTIYTDSQITSAKAEYEIKSADPEYTAMSDWFANKLG